jgi:hypothetical protein
MQAKIIKMLEERIEELQEDEWRAKEAKDYTACLYLYGASMYFKKFLHEVREISNENSNSQS